MDGMAWDALADGEFSTVHEQQKQKVYSPPLVLFHTEPPLSCDPCMASETAFFLSSLFLLRFGMDGTNVFSHLF